MSPLTRAAIRSAALSVTLAAAACHNAPTPSPSASPPVVSPSAPTPAVTVFEGRLTASNGGEPLGGVAVDFGGLAATTDASGGFSYRYGPGATRGRLTFTAPGILTRSLVYAADVSRIVAADAVVLKPPFDLDFYRQLVRNDLEAPGQLQPLRRWSSAPSVYVQTVDTANRPIDTGTLDSTVGTIRAAVAEWTGGVFSNVIVERGTESRIGQDGWVTVIWDGTGSEFCGTALVGGGEIHFSPRTSGCRCPGTPGVTATTVRHEIGHMLGFWHTPAVTDVMYRSAGFSCDLPMSPRERFHSALAYRRPRGNVDPDSDPGTIVNVAPMRIE